MKVKNPKAPAVKREAEEDWGRRNRDSHARSRDRFLIGIMVTALLVHFLP